jgi:transcriptional regulator with GAF, ATPase, and Fis domain
LVDLRSKNGTSVNGARVAEIPLQNEDWISFGGLLARFERISEEKVQDLLAERATRLQSFLQTRRDLDGSLEPPLFLRRTIESVLELSGAQRGFLFLVKPSGDVEAEVAAGFPPFEQLDDRFRGSFEAIEKVFKTGDPVVSSNAKPGDFSSRRRSVEELGTAALACVPLKANGRITGLIYVEGRKNGGLFSDLDLEILEALADHAALSMGGARLEQPIRELVGPSAPSVAPGSRSFLDELERRVGEIARAVRATLTSN